MFLVTDWMTRAKQFCFLSVDSDKSRAEQCQSLGVGGGGQHVSLCFCLRGLLFIDVAACYLGSVGPRLPQNGGVPGMLRPVFTLGTASVKALTPTFGPLLFYIKLLRENLRPPVY